MNRMKSRISCATVVGVLLFAHQTSAATITLGTQDFTNGSFISSVSFELASLGEPSPFNGFCGSDPAPGPNCSRSFSFNFAGDATVSDASFTIGLVDHDSAAAGDQVALFTIGGFDYTAALNTLLNASGGTQLEYNVYSLALTSNVFAAIAAGSVPVVLTFQGPGLGSGITLPNNGVGLDFASLTYSTATAPEPGSILLFGTALLAAGVRRRRQKRS